MRKQLKNSIALVLLLLFFTNGFTQNEFACIVGEINKNDRAYSITQTFNGDFAVLGQTQILGAGKFDIFLLKFSSDGSLEWAKTYGGPEHDLGFDIIQTPDGYVFTGNTRSFGDSNQTYIAKVGAMGTLESFIVIGGTDNDESWEVIRTADNGFAISGCTMSFGAGSYDVLIAKFDSSFAFEWAKVIGGLWDDYSVDCLQTEDGGYAIEATSKSFPPNAGIYRNMLVIKLDLFGELEWAKSIGTDSTEYGESITQTYDGSYVMSGLTYKHWKDSTRGVDALFAKIDSLGNLQWARTIGTESFDVSLCHNNTYDMGYVMTGETGPWKNGDFFIAKLDSSCDTIEWAKSIGIGGKRDRGEYIIQTDDMSYAAVGATMSYVFAAMDTIWNVMFLKLDTNGNNGIANDVFPTLNPISVSTIDITSTITIANISPLIMDVTSDVQEMEVNPRFLMLYPTSIKDNALKREAKILSLDLVPNPFNSRVLIRFSLPKNEYISLKIFDVLGREIVTIVDGMRPAGINTVNWEADGISSGVYFCALKVGDKYLKTKKLLVWK